MMRARYSRRSRGRGMLSVSMRMPSLICCACRTDQAGGRAPPHHRAVAGGRSGDGQMTPVRLTVNDIRVVETMEPRTHLADLLREKLGLTGTHLRCEQGACGACTLLIDGQPARSCITYAVLCEGAEITTIEGLEHDSVMAALRRAFAAEHGLQCGFCTPGMLITARDIVMRLPDADERRIRLELSGNLCRCTGYVGIVRAIRRVLEERRRREPRRRGFRAMQAGAGRIAACRAARRHGFGANSIQASMRPSAKRARSSGKPAWGSAGKSRPSKSVSRS